MSYKIEDATPPSRYEVGIRNTEEYKVMDQMKVNQAVTFPPEKKRVFEYARKVFHDCEVKRFVIRRVDSFNWRIFRIKDGEIGTKLRTRRSKTKPKEGAKAEGGLLEKPMIVRAEDLPTMQEPARIVKRIQEQEKHF